MAISSYGNYRTQRKKTIIYYAVAAVIVAAGGVFFYLSKPQKAQTSTTGRNT